MPAPSLQGLSPRTRPSVTNSTDLLVLSGLTKEPATVTMPAPSLQGLSRERGPL
ncbi:MAG UNVERIFIED_CONTAM: hypothetical protein LVR18_28585 [Planctomycetaceae bacterium]